MPTREEHTRKKESAYFTRSELQKSKDHSKHADWIVTISFYKALHAVDSFLAEKGVHPEEHTGKGFPMGRNQRVRTDPILKRIYPKYKALYEASRQARYEAYTFEGNTNEVAKLIKQSDEIEDYVNQHLTN